MELKHFCYLAIDHNDADKFYIAALRARVRGLPELQKFFSKVPCVIKIKEKLLTTLSVVYIFH